MHVDADDVEAEDARRHGGRCPERQSKHWKQGDDAQGADDPGHAASGSTLITASLPIVRRTRSIPWRRARNAVTTSGSNWRPDSARIAAITASELSPWRYGRSEVSASKTSATDRMRTASGMAVPRKPVG